jgi:recombination DNA repair RAD52 pathway protein
MTDWNNAENELKKKLDPANVRPPSQFGPKGDYIESHHAIAEANRIFGHFGWSAVNVRMDCVSEKPRKIGKAQKDGWGVTYVCTREVTVNGVTRQGTGAGHGYDADLGLAHESASKEAESDAEKRALRTFGNPFGLALYDKTRANVGVDAGDNEIEAAIEGVNACDSLESLIGYWSNLNKNAKHVAADQRVITAKDVRKTELEK